jgi:hypothetical protein
VLHYDFLELILIVVYFGVALPFNFNKFIFFAPKLFFEVLDLLLKLLTLHLALLLLHPPYTFKALDGQSLSLFDKNHLLSFELNILSDFFILLFEFLQLIKQVLWLLEGVATDRGFYAVAQGFQKVF